MSGGGEDRGAKESEGSQALYRSLSGIRLLRPNVADSGQAGVRLPEPQPDCAIGDSGQRASVEHSRFIGRRSRHRSYFLSIMPPSICNTWPVVYVLVIRKM
jgi:hypothetical protein